MTDSWLPLELSSPPRRCEWSQGRARAWEDNLLPHLRGQEGDRREGEANQRNSFSGSSLLTDWLVTLCSACKCMINKTTQCQLWGQCSGRDVDTQCAGSRGREAGTQRRAASERNVCRGADLTGECLGCSWWVFLGCTHPDNDSNCNTSLSRYCKISRKFVE